MDYKRNTRVSTLAMAVILVVFVVLKLCRVTDWPWFWVLSPLWVSGVLLVIALLLVLGLAIILREE